MTAILFSASLATNLIIDGVGHNRQDGQCMFDAYYNHTVSPGQVQSIGGISPLVLIIPSLMYDLAVLLLSISILEFTVAQAPYPMKGMIIGLYYFFIGFYSLLGIGYHEIVVGSLSSLPGYSCCSLYYTIGTIISLLITVLTFWTTSKYKYRERSEVINEYQFIENYYST